MLFTRHNVILAIIFLSTIFFVEFYIYTDKKDEEAVILKYMGTKSNNIEDSMISIINSAALINSGLKFILKNTTSDKTQSEFEDFVTEYNVNLPYIQYIIITKNNKIQYSYMPSKSDVNYDFSLIEQTFKNEPENKILLTSPNLKLKESLKISTPFWLDDKNLLVIHTAIDFSSLVIYSNLTTYAKKISYALVNSENSELLSGNPNLYQKDSWFTKELKFYNAKWLLHLKGANDKSFEYLSVRIFGLFLSILFVYIVGIVFRQQERINESSLFDKSTRCMKMHFFIQILKNHIPYAQRQRASFGVIYIRVRGLSYVNRKFGPKIKSFVLKEIASQIQQGIRKSDVLAANSQSSEFVILIKNSRDIKAIDTVTCKLSNNILSPLIYKDEIIKVRLNIGCAYYPKEANEAEHLIEIARNKMLSNGY